MDVLCGRLGSVRRSIENAATVEGFLSVPVFKIGYICGERNAYDRAVLTGLKMRSPGYSLQQQTKTRKDAPVICSKKLFTWEILTISFPVWKRKVLEHQKQLVDNTVGFA